MWFRSKIFLWSICLPLLVATASAQDIAIVPPPPAPPTLWNFLGIPQGARKVHGAVFNRRGNRPKIENKPPLKAIGDPINLLSPNEAIKQAAKVKQEEDLKPQKIKAIKYLTSIGCGCYDKDNEITMALIAAADDCTEDVRVTTMEELYNASQGKCCNKCGMSCCCKEPLLKKLAQIAYERDEFGCYLEPSQRVREGAVKVLQSCAPSPIPPIIEQDKPAPIVPVNPLEDPIVPEGTQPDREEIFREGQPEETNPSIDPDRIDKPSVFFQPRDRSQRTTGEATREAVTSDEMRSNETLRPVPSGSKETSFHLSSYSPAKLQRPAALRIKPNQPQPIVNPDISLSSSPNPEGGVIIGYDPDHSLAYVHFEDAKMLVSIGTLVYVQVDPTRGSGYRGLWKVISAAPGRVNLVPEELSNESLLMPGDHVMFGEPPVSVAPVGYIDRQ